MPQNVAIYGVFICSVCGQPLQTFVSTLNVRTVKCVNSLCANYLVAFQPPSVTITEA